MQKAHLIILFLFFFGQVLTLDPIPIKEGAETPFSLTIDKQELFYKYEQEIQSQVDDYVISFKDASMNTMKLCVYLTEEVTKDQDGFYTNCYKEFQLPLPKENIVTIIQKKMFYVVFKCVECATGINNALTIQSVSIITMDQQIVPTTLPSKMHRFSIKKTSDSFLRFTIGSALGQKVYLSLYKTDYNSMPLLEKELVNESNVVIVKSKDIEQEAVYYIVIKVKTPQDQKDYTLTILVNTEIKSRLVESGENNAYTLDYIKSIDMIQYTDFLDSGTDTTITFTTEPKETIEIYIYTSDVIELNHKGEFINYEVKVDTSISKEVIINIPNKEGSLCLGYQIVFKCLTCQEDTVITNTFTMTNKQFPIQLAAGKKYELNTLYMKTLKFSIEKPEEMAYAFKINLESVQSVNMKLFKKGFNDPIEEAHDASTLAIINREIDLPYLIDYLISLEIIKAEVPPYKLSINIEDITVMKCKPIASFTSTDMELISANDQCYSFSPSAIDFSLSDNVMRFNKALGTDAKIYAYENYDDIKVNEAKEYINPLWSSTEEVTKNTEVIINTYLKEKTLFIIFRCLICKQSTSPYKNTVAIFNEQEEVIELPFNNEDSLFDKVYSKKRKMFSITKQANGNQLYMIEPNKEIKAKIELYKKNNDEMTLIYSAEIDKRHYIKRTDEYAEKVDYRLIIDLTPKWADDNHKFTARGYDNYIPSIQYTTPIDSIQLFNGKAIFYFDMKNMAQRELGAFTLSSQEKFEEDQIKFYAKTMLVDTVDDIDIEVLENGLNIPKADPNIIDSMHYITYYNNNIEKDESKLSVFIYIVIVDQNTKEYKFSLKKSDKAIEIDIDSKQLIVTKTTVETFNPTFIILKWKKSDTLKNTLLSSSNKVNYYPKNILNADLTRNPPEIVNIIGIDLQNNQEQATIELFSNKQEFIIQLETIEAIIIKDDRTPIKCTEAEAKAHKEIYYYNNQASPFNEMVYTLSVYGLIEVYIQDSTSIKSSEDNQTMLPGKLVNQIYSIDSSSYLFKSKCVSEGETHIIYSQPSKSTIQLESNIGIYSIVLQKGTEYIIETQKIKGKNIEFSSIQSDITAAEQIHLDANGKEYHLDDFTSFGIENISFDKIVILKLSFNTLLHIKLAEENQPKEINDLYLIKEKLFYYKLTESHTFKYVLELEREIPGLQYYYGLGTIGYIPIPTSSNSLFNLNSSKDIVINPSNFYGFPQATNFLYIVISVPQDTAPFTITFTTFSLPKLHNKLLINQFQYFDDISLISLQNPSQDISSTHLVVMLSQCSKVNHLMSLSYNYNSITELKGTKGTKVYSFPYKENLLFEIQYFPTEEGSSQKYYMSYTFMSEASANDFGNQFNDKSFIITYDDKLNKLNWGALSKDDEYQYDIYIMKKENSAMMDSECDLKLMGNNYSTGNNYYILDKEKLENGEYKVNILGKYVGKKSMKYDIAYEVLVFKKITPFTANYWIWIGAGLIFIIIVGLIIFFVMRRKKKMVNPDSSVDAILNAKDIEDIPEDLREY